MALTAFASRQPASYIKGTTFDGDVTTAQMLDLANLSNWNVRLRLIDTDARRGAESFEVVRDNPFDGGLDRLGISGERYREIQNEEAFAMFDVLSPVWEAAGQFKGGTIVYGQAVTDKSIVIDPNGAADEIKPNIVISTGHGGAGALRLGRTAMRLDCFNQFNLMFGGRGKNRLQHAVTIKHTKSAAAKMKAITLFWKENNLWTDTLSAEANALFQTAATDRQFFAIVDQFQGERPDVDVKGSQTKWDNRREAFAQAWKGEPNVKAFGTAWGVFNALIEVNQWGRTIQKTTNGVDNFALAGMGFDNLTNTFRQNAFEAAKSLVTV